MKNNKLDKILAGMDKGIAKLDAVAINEHGKAKKLRAKAQDNYALPDKIMLHVNKLVNAIHYAVMELNRKAFAQAQVLSRKAGEHEAVAERAERVAKKFSNLIK